MRHSDGLRAASAASTAVVLTTITWNTNYIDSGSISGVNFTATETAPPASESCLSTALPSVTTTGFYFDLQVIEGHPSYINFIGVANTTTNFDYGSTSQTTWYWSGGIFGAGSGTGPGNVTAGTHRIAVRSESGASKVYFQKDTPTGAIAGPFTAPSGTLYACIINQGGFKVGDITIANGGNVYEGGGGLF